MSLKNKINQRLKESSDWILNDPKSMAILLLMGSGIGFLCFTTFTLVFFLSKNWLFFIIFGLFAYMSLKKFVQICRMVKLLGLKDALGGFTANQFVWKKDKYGGKEDGNNGTDTSNEARDRNNAKGNKEIGDKIRGDKENIESTNPWDSLSIRIDKSNRKETRNK